MLLTLHQRQVVHSVLASLCVFLLNLGPSLTFTFLFSARCVLPVEPSKSFIVLKLQPAITVFRAQLEQQLVAIAKSKFFTVQLVLWLFSPFQASSTSQLQPLPTLLIS